MPPASAATAACATAYEPCAAGDSIAGRRAWSAQSRSFSFAGIVHRPTRKQFFDEIGPVTHQHDVAAGRTRRRGARDDIACHAGRFHGQIVAENNPFESEHAAQHVAQPEGREARRFGRDLFVDDVCRHDAAEALREQSKRHGIFGKNCFEIARIAGDVHMRIRFDETMPWKMLADATHAAARKAVNQRAGQLDRDFRPAMKSAVANHTALAIIEIEHRCIRQIDAVANQFCRQHLASLPRHLARSFRVVLPHAAECAHAGHGSEAFSKPLYAAAFVVNGDEQCWIAKRANFRRQRSKLLT